MIVYGIDFTSAPRRKKPITCAECTFDRGTLILKELSHLPDFNNFEALISQTGEWIAGLDFPFGQSRKLIKNLNWPLSWAGYVAHISLMTRDEFIQTLENYKEPRPKGDREHKRATDEKAGSISPQKLYGVPVAKMFFEGSVRILHSPASILPVRPNDDHRVIIEAYPALVARRWTGGRSYKSDDPRKNTEDRRDARHTIVRSLLSRGLRDVYGFDVVAENQHAKAMICCPGADDLDALLCAIQAAWAFTQRSHRYGVPENADLLEGWIVDPSQLLD